MEQLRTHFLYFTLCEGGDLLDYTISAGGMDESQARRFFEQMALALGHLHQLGVAHRDVKLDNFFLCSGGRVRLGDLGLAALSEDVPSASTSPPPLLCRGFFGSECYSAPEVCAYDPVIREPGNAEASRDTACQMQFEHLDPYDAYAGES